MEHSSPVNISCHNWNSSNSTSLYTIIITFHANISSFPVFKKPIFSHQNLDFNIKTLSPRTITVHKFPRHLRTSIILNRISQKKKQKTDRKMEHKCKDWVAYVLAGVGTSICWLLNSMPKSTDIRLTSCLSNVPEIRFRASRIDLSITGMYIQSRQDLKTPYHYYHDQCHQTSCAT